MNREIKLICPLPLVDLIVMTADVQAGGRVTGSTDGLVHSLSPSQNYGNKRCLEHVFLEQHLPTVFLDILGKTMASCDRQ